MGAARKIQAEIDRTLKRVQEGIDDFDDIWRKVYDPDTSINQKEKFEADLKKEIKKLQRYRDDIKKWLVNNDIKDKNDLLKARKDIEHEMERFKLCEKEMKTKAFSKEGLGAAIKQDPREAKRDEARGWMNDNKDKLEQQMEDFEAELETLESSAKRSKKPPARVAHFRESLERHRKHVMQLETLLRLLDNDQLNVDDTLNETRDLLEDYMDRNQEDFDDFANPEDIYEALDLDNIPQLPTVTVPHAPGVVNAPRDKEKDREKERERAAAAAIKGQLAAHGLTRLEEDEAKKPAVPAVRATSASSTPSTAAAGGRPSTAGSGTLAVATQVQPGQLGRENSSGTPRSGAAGQTPTSPTAAGSDPASQQRSPALGPSQTPPQPSPMRSAVPEPVPTMLDCSTGVPPISTQPAGPRPYAGAAAAVLATGVPAPTAPPPAPVWPPPSQEAAPRPTAPAAAEQQPPQQQPQPQQNNHAAQPEHPANGMRGGGGVPVPTSPGHQQAPQTSAPPAAGPQGAPGQATAGVPGPGASAGTETPAGPPVVAEPQADNVAAAAGGGGADERSFLDGLQATAPVAGALPHASPALHLQLLSACAGRGIPLASDSVWEVAPMRTRPPHGVSIPESYPTQKLPLFSDPRLFEKLDPEALFFSFYYQPGTFQQYLAARELKRQSWRYHKQHSAWFQRHEEPKQATEEYEVGTYVYFDFNIVHDGTQSGWCYRLKQDFTFKYDALEDFEI